MRFVSWEVHLAKICRNDNQDVYLSRYTKILAHISAYEYPALTEQERHAIRVIAESLYENIKSEAEKSLAMYRRLDEAFVKATYQAVPQDLE